MVRHLDIDESVLKENGAIHTAKEIAGQPELWKDIYAKIFSEKDEIRSFFNQVISNTKKIILTGAGTSNYIGYSIEGAIQRNKKITTLTVPTTHLVSHPKDYFESSVPTLLVSFARSGNSPESVAAVQLANEHIKNCQHLIISRSGILP